MPNIPPPETFDRNLEVWSQYMDRVQFYFLANNLTDKVKLPIFLSLLGREVYATLCQLLSPDHPSTKTFTQIVDTLNNYYKPRILVPVERFHFIRRKQEAAESIKDFVKALRHLSTNCEYGDSVALDNRLCEQFIYGLRDKKIRERLLTEERISFDDAVKISLAAECAFQGTQELESEAASNNVLFHEHRDSTPKNSLSLQNPHVACNHCGSKKHSSATCKFKEAICHACGSKGHIAPVCKKKRCLRLRKTNPVLLT